MRVIKQHVQGLEDIQAFNMLANDYNSRCSNFYYLDEDLKIVTEEVKAKKQMLEADAMRILSTWPWHAASDNALTSTDINCEPHGSGKSGCNRHPRGRRVELSAACDVRPECAFQFVYLGDFIVPCSSDAVQMGRKLGLRHSFT